MNRTTRRLTFITALIAFITTGYLGATEPSEAPYCGTCERYGLGVICQGEQLKQFSGIFIDSLSNTRSPFQIDEYIRCHLAHKPNLVIDYETDYQKYIKTTSESFSVPPQLLQCILLIESSYNKDIEKSHAGAQGMCQIMPKTRKYIGEIIESARKRRESGKIAQARVEIRNNEVKEVDVDYYKTILQADDLLGRWDQNFDQLIKNDLYPYPNSDGSITNPETFSKTGALRPQNCIAGAGLYLSDMMSSLSPSFLSLDRDAILSSTQNSNDNNSSNNLMIILGAAYNAGPGSVNKILKDVKPPASLNTLINTLNASDNSEMKDYMKSINNCLTPQNFDPPSRWYTEGGMAPPTCDEVKTSERNLGLLPVEHWPWEN